MHGARVTVGVVLAAGLAAFACNSGGGSASTASGFSQQYCTLISQCCSQAGLSSDPSRCEELISALSSSSSYNASAGQACIDGLQKESSAGTLCKEAGSDVPQCSEVYGGSGTATPGQTCSKTSDCAAGSTGAATCFNQTTFLDGGGTSNTSTCVQTQTGKAGDSPCIGTRDGQVTYFSGFSGPPPGTAYICDETMGSTCDSNTKTCTAQASTGQPCTGDMTCVSSDYCAFEDGGQSCVARLANGASCASSFNACMTGSYCDSSSQTCKAGLTDGTTCTTSQQCQSSTCTNGKCAGSSNFGLSLYCAQ